jgi:hypothetical protein
MKQRSVALVVLLAMSALAGPSIAAAQAPPLQPARPVPVQAPAPPPAPVPLAPFRMLGEPVNIRIEVRITAAGDPPYAKTFMLTVGDGGAAQIRGDQRGGGRANYLHVDARPRLVDDKVRLQLTFEHDLPDFSGAPNADGRPAMPNMLTENMDVVLDSGKPLVVGQHLDAASNRAIAVEVTATVLR